MSFNTPHSSASPEPTAPDAPTAASDQTAIVIGLDVGSTTVKATVVDPATRAILWRDYQRHHTRQPESVLDFLERIGVAFPRATDVRVFMTGSGAGPICTGRGAYPTGPSAVDAPAVISTSTRYPTPIRRVMFFMNRSSPSMHIR